jgi:hypothetical protein
MRIVQFLTRPRLHDVVSRNVRQRQSVRSTAILSVCVSLAMIGGADAEYSRAPSFDSVVLHVGGDPYAVTVADVDRDGSPDIVAANPEAGTVTVLLGDGRRDFRPAPHSPFAAGRLPNDVGVGDFDGDGNPDLVIANHQAPYLTMLLGDGRGGFRPAPHSPFATSSNPHPHGLAVGHFCGQGRPLDVVVDSWASNQIELMMGDGHGNLSNGPMSPAGPGSDSPLGSGDLDGNGTPDIVMPDTAIGRWNSTVVSVLLGDGACGFRMAPGSPFPAGSVPWTVAVGRLGRDKTPDLLILPYGPQVKDPGQIVATVLRGNGDGAFAPMAGSPFRLPGCSDPGRVAIGDVDADAISDFVVTCRHEPDVLLFRGTRDGGFDVAHVDVRSGSDRSFGERGIAIANLTRGGGNAIIITNGTAGTITLLFRS